MDLKAQEDLVRSLHSLRMTGMRVSRMVLEQLVSELDPAGVQKETHTV